MRFHRGIILKSYIPQKQKLSLLDNYLGKIEGILIPHPTLLISPGMILQYNPCTIHQRYRLTELTLYDTPLFLARTDLLFLHQLLELCYLLVPENFIPDTLFDRITLAFNATEKLFFNAESKILFMLRLFWELGFYPEEAIQINPHIIIFFSLPIELMIAKAVDCSLEQLQEIMKICIRQLQSKNNMRALAIR